MLHTLMGDWRTTRGCSTAAMRILRAQALSGRSLTENSGYMIVVPLLGHEAERYTQQCFHEFFGTTSRKVQIWLSSTPAATIHLRNAEFCEPGSICIKSWDLYGSGGLILQTAQLKFLNVRFIHPRLPVGLDILPVQCTPPQLETVMSFCGRAATIRLSIMQLSNRTGRPFRFSLLSHCIVPITAHGRRRRAAETDNQASPAHTKSASASTDCHPVGLDPRKS